MRDIAEAADLSPGNLYHYFRGKDELLYFCQDRTLDRLLEALKTARRAATPLVDRLTTLAQTHLRCLIDDIEGSAAHLEVDALPPRLRLLIVAKRDRYERGVRTLVAGGIRSGDFAPTDPTIATRALLGALNWTPHWFRPDGQHSAQYVSEIVANHAVAGLLTDVHASTRFHRARRQRRSDRRVLRSVQDTPRGAA
jgi:AcrR family transcriptional regulator